MQWEPVIGFEVHTELKTNSKNFCSCSTAFGAAPNTQVCPVCLGLPGTLPVLNRTAVDLALKTALALQCRVEDRCNFDRKNYYYPDLPKNYQISQNYRNLGVDGVFEIDLGEAGTKKIGISNVHLEEDAGKNIHPEGRAVDYTLVDLNRAGTPLLEIVGAPDIRTKDEAYAFMQGMRTLLMYLDVTEGKMQEGRIRFELNISLRPAGTEEYGQKVEIKNLNSVQVVLRCIDHEIERQARLLESGERVAGETRLWDEAEGITRAMRSKERANDYRYFPEPDLPELFFSPEHRAEVLASIPELPVAKKMRFIESFGLPPYDAWLLTTDVALAHFYERAVAAHNNPKGIANWIMGDILRVMKDLGEDATVEDLKITAEALAELVLLIDDKIITGTIAKQVFPIMLETGDLPTKIVEDRGLKPVDDSALDPIIEAVIAANPGPAEDVRAGKAKAIGFLMGQIMRQTKGKANPATVEPLLKRKLGVE